MRSPDDYNVIMMSFPGDVLAAVRVDSDGYPTIYINDALSEPARREALAHELRHIESGDLSNHLTIYQAETRAAAAVPLPGLMMRSARELTEAETWRLLLAGVKLFAGAYDDPPRFDLALQLPEPIFARDPQPNLFEKEVIS